MIREIHYLITVLVVIATEAMLWSAVLAGGLAVCGLALGVMSVTAGNTIALANNAEAVVMVLGHAALFLAIYVAGRKTFDSVSTKSYHYHKRRLP